MDYQRMKGVIAAINRHGARLGHGKEVFIQKALAMWDSAVKENALPTVDTLDADIHREELEAKQRHKPRPVQSSERNKRKIMLKLKQAKPGNNKPLSPTTKIIERLDGTQWLYQVAPDGKLMVRQLGKYRTPVFVEQYTDQKQPAKADDSKGTATMQKSKLNNLIARARKNPAALSQQTLATLNQHLAKTGQATITVPAPTRQWGTMPTIGDIARNVQHATAQTAAVPVPKTGVFAQACVTAASGNGRATANLSGHQRAAMSAGLSPDHPGLEKMSFPEMQAAAKQQQLATANAIRQKQGLPPIS